MSTRAGDGPGTLLSALARSAPEIVVLRADRKGRILEVSAAARPSLALAAEGPEGAALSGLLAQADAGTVEALLAGAPGVHGPRLLNLLDGAGSPFTVRAMIGVGEEEVVVAGVRAVEEEGHLGDELVRLNNELAAATRESARKGRELERALGELRQAQALLVHQEKMASLGQTTAGVAHEINNPLAFVASNTETLSRDFEDLFGFVNAVGDLLDEVRAAAPSTAAAIDEAAAKADLVALADTIPARFASSREGLERIRGIVSDLRTFSRLDEAERKEADLVESLAATIRFLGPLQKERDVRVETDFPPRLQLVCAPGALNQAVANLLLNAVQASRPGQSVRLRLRREGDVVRIRVEDDGCGISKRDLPKVFDPFFTTKPVGEGTGLGLAIAHQVVQAHGGTIGIESEPGRGTTVTVALPVKAGGAA